LLATADGVGTVKIMRWTGMSKPTVWRWQERYLDEGVPGLKREIGSLSPKPQGNPGRGKLTGVKDWVRCRITAQPDLTIDELTADLAADHGLQVHRSSGGRLLLRLGLSHKKRPAGA
jgi:transposase